MKHTCAHSYYLNRCAACQKSSSDLWKALSKSWIRGDITYVQDFLLVKGLCEWLSTLEPEQGLRVMDKETKKCYIITEVKDENSK